MGLIWFFVAVIVIGVGIVWLAESHRRRGFGRTLPRDLPGRARRAARHTERLRSTHVREINGIRPSGDRNIGGAG
jgi:GNAT superfamily N-acetyltransferase